VDGLPGQDPGKSLIWSQEFPDTQVLLTVAAVVSLALGIYQASPAGPPHIVYNEDCPRETGGCVAPSLEWVEGVAIVVAIVIIVMVGSLTDFQKERQFQKLNAQREDRTVKVIRDGQEQQINTKDLVVGDIALLEPGEILPVDGVFLSGHNIRCDESGATGESDAIKKVSFDDCVAERDGLEPGGKRKLDCFLVSGAKVLEGVGSYVVISSGTNTFNGRIMMGMSFYSVWRQMLTSSYAG
jgi:Ca2+-transporting ATPase